MLTPETPHGQVVNNASRLFAEFTNSAQVFQTRVNSGRTTSIVDVIFDYIVRGSYIRDIKSGNSSFVSERRLIKKKRPKDELHGGNFNIQSVLQKARIGGFLQLDGVIIGINNIIDHSKLANDPQETAYKDAEDLKRFLEELDSEESVKKSLGICCTKLQAIKPRAIACKGSNCVCLIDLGSTCWECSTDTESIVICTACHSARKAGDLITVKVKVFANQDHLNNECNMTDKHKSEFKRITLKTLPIPEKTVKCIMCRCEHHIQCVMYDAYNWSVAYGKNSKGFSEDYRPVYVCQRCRDVLKGDHSSPNSNVQDVQFFPQDIHPTTLSRKMESDLKTFLTCKGADPADIIYVREVSSQKAIFVAKPNMRKEFEKNNRPVEWAYRHRSIALFHERRDTGYPIAVFNLIVHEYPSTQTISLSYIDSVKMFEPQNLRRGLFQETILSYLDDCRRRGFRKVYFWVCPPQSGDEYVFYGRPEENHPSCPQGSDSGIIRWYKEMLGKGKQKDYVESYQQSGESNNPYSNYLDMPYLMDDFWPPKLETIMETYNKELQEYESYQSASVRVSKKHRTSVKVKKSSNSGMPASIHSRIEEVVRTECKNTLFCVNLKVPEEYDQNKEVEEEADILSPYMCNRDNFIVDCRENQYDFSSSRRAQYATLIMISRMAKESFSQKCFQCEKVVKRGVYCYRCPGRVSCMNCASCLCPDNHNCLRMFQVPFANKKIDPDPIFDEILKYLASETEFLSNLGFNICSPESKIVNHVHPRFHYGVNAILEHTKLLNENHHRQNQTKCRVCVGAWLPLLRHKEFCRGNNCCVPSCTGNILFNNQGIILKSNAKQTFTLKNK